MNISWWVVLALGIFVIVIFPIIIVQTAVWLEERRIK
jgi:hypothetical protein